VEIDFDVSTPGKTTLKAVGGYIPPTEVVWNPAANPAGNGLWNEDLNWTGGLKPAPVTKVIFNVSGANPCTVTNAAAAKQLVMGDNGPGGQLNITAGGILSCGSEAASAIGYNNTAAMTVENGAVVTFGHQLWVGLDPGSDGTLTMNGGSVSVANMFGLGWQGGKGTVRVKGGVLSLAQWDDLSSIQGSSVMDVSAMGKVVINGDHQGSVYNYISTGQITNSSGAGLNVDYNIVNVGKTTIYPADVYIPPAQVTWTPALNLDNTLGLWNDANNWVPAMVPGDVTAVTFNVADSIPCIVTNAAIAGWFQMGNSGGPGGTVVLTNGGSLTTVVPHWVAVGYSSPATMIVESGSSASFQEHLWVGFEGAADGTFIMNGGTVSVKGMFGLGWNGGKGTANINGGTLNLSQWHPTDSIKGASTLTVTKTGTVSITGNHVNSVSNYVSSGKIKADAGNTVAYSFDGSVNKTQIQVAPPQQSIATFTSNGGNTTIVYQTTPGHIYHLEATTSLSPAAWTAVAGSATNATGTAVSFTLPADAGQMFYRTVSP